MLSPLKLDKAWDPSFFGIPLGQSPSHLMSSIAIVAISIPILTAVFQFVQSKMMFSPGPKTQTKKNDDFASAFQSQATYIFPIMIAFWYHTAI